MMNRRAYAICALCLSTFAGCASAPPDDDDVATTQSAARGGGRGGGGTTAPAGSVITFETAPYYAPPLGWVHGVATVPSAACQYDNLKGDLVINHACGSNEYCDLQHQGVVRYPNDPTVHGTNNGTVQYGMCHPLPDACASALDTVAYCMRSDAPSYSRYGGIYERLGRCYCDASVVHTQ